MGYKKSEIKYQMDQIEKLFSEKSEVNGRVSAISFMKNVLYTLQNESIIKNNVVNYSANSAIRQKCFDDFKSDEFDLPEEIENRYIYLCTSFEILINDFSEMRALIGILNSPMKIDLQFTEFIRTYTIEIKKYITEKLCDLLSTAEDDLTNKNFDISGGSNQINFGNNLSGNSSINQIINHNEIDELFKKLREELSKIQDEDFRDDIESRIDTLEAMKEKPDKSKLEKIKGFFSKHSDKISVLLFNLGMQAINNMNRG